MKISETDKKKATILVGIAGAGVLLYFIFRNKTEKFDPTGNPNYIPAQPAFNAKAVAESLFDAMNRMGTETDAIWETLKSVNANQFAQVVEVFGKKAYNSLTGNQVNLNPLATLPKLGLKNWLKEELSAKDYAILKLKYPYSL